MMQRVVWPTNKGLIMLTSTPSAVKHKWNSHWKTCSQLSEQGLDFPFTCPSSLASWNPTLSLSQQTSASFLKLLSWSIGGKGLCLTQVRKALSWRSPSLSALHTSHWLLEQDTSFGCVLEAEKMARFFYSPGRLLSLRHCLPNKQTASVSCQVRDQGISYKVCDLCVAFHQSRGFSAHWNQAKQQDVHTFADTQETSFFRPKLCFSGFFLLHFSVRRYSTIVVNYLWGLGVRFFSLFHQLFFGK